MKKRTPRTRLAAVAAASALGIGVSAALAMRADEPPKEADAQKLWEFLQDAQYEHWAPFPGQPADCYEGARPHGALLKTYINRTAAGSVDEPEHGSIIVKENYTPDKKLAAITVMQRIEGYDDDNMDWFWVKYNADGSVAQANGDAIAGKVDSCIACHRTAGGGDYLFDNEQENE